MVVRQETVQFRTVCGQTHNFLHKAAIMDDLCMCVCVRMCVSVCACVRVFNLLKAKNKVFNIKTQLVLLLPPDMLHWATSLFVLR